MPQELCSAVPLFVTVLCALCCAVIAAVLYRLCCRCCVLFGCFIRLSLSSRKHPALAKLRVNLPLPLLVKACLLQKFCVACHCFFFFYFIFWVFFRFVFHFLFCVKRVTKPERVITSLCVFFLWCVLSSASPGDTPTCLSVSRRRLLVVLCFCLVFHSSLHSLPLTLLFLCFPWPCDLHICFS